MAKTDLATISTAPKTELNTISSFDYTTFIVRNIGTALRVIPDGSMSESEITESLFSEDSDDLDLYMYDIPLDFINEVLDSSDELFVDFCQFLTETLTESIILEDIIDLFTELHRCNINTSNIINILRSARLDDLCRLISIYKGNASDESYSLLEYFHMII